MPTGLQQGRFSVTGHNSETPVTPIAKNAAAQGPRLAEQGVREPSPPLSAGARPEREVLATEESLVQQKAEGLSELIGTVAHDCNNLLSSIVAHAELAMTESTAGASPKEEIDRIKAIAVRTAEIIRELMVYGGQETRGWGAIDLSELISEMVQLLRISVSKNVTVKTKFAKHVPLIRANAPQVRQVLMNLMLNASEAIGGRGGEITVSTRCLTVRHPLSLPGGLQLPPGTYAVLDVSDSGHGMTEEVRSRAFNRSFTTKHAGHGLGLAIVREIVRAHGGAIAVNSVEGKGARFEIFFPAGAKVPQRRPAVHAETDVASGANWSILIVEDEEALRLGISKMLRNHGLSVIEAGDGYSAIELFHQHMNTVDLVLLDVTIPGASSRYVLEEIRRMRPGAKVILTSAYSWETAANGLDWRYAAGFIRKPYEFTDLLRCIRSAIVS